MLIFVILAQKHLVVPSNKVVGEIGLLFSRMSNTYCAITKLEYLLETVRLIYEHVCVMLGHSIIARMIACTFVCRYETTDVLKKQLQTLEQMV